jgi:hypothetical protein
MTDPAGGSKLQLISNPFAVMIPYVDTFIATEMETHESFSCTVYECAHGSRIGYSGSVALSAYGAGVA